MRTETTTRTLFKFDELSDEAKEKARDWYRQASAWDDFFSEFVVDDAKAIGELIGIDIENIYWSGFWSQGDGACFEGTWGFKKNSMKLLKAHAPKDAELHNIAETLAALQKANRYQLSASVKHRGHYYHDGCTEIEVTKDDGYPSDDTEEKAKEALRDYMRWIYRRLEAEWEYQNADEQVDESIRSNEYEFTEDGRIA